MPMKSVDEVSASGTDDPTVPPPVPPRLDVVVPLANAQSDPPDEEVAADDYEIAPILLPPATQTQPPGSTEACIIPQDEFEGAASAPPLPPRASPDPLANARPDHAAQSTPDTYESLLHRPDSEGTQANCVVQDLHGRRVFNLRHITAMPPEIVNADSYEFPGPRTH